MDNENTPLPPLPKPRSTRDKTITFRVEPEIYAELAEMAINRGWTMSYIMNSISKKFFKDWKMSLNAWNYFQSLTKEQQKEILAKESEMPEHYHYYTNILSQLFRQEVLDNWEINDIPALRGNIRGKQDDRP